MNTEQKELTKLATALRKSGYEKQANETLRLVKTAAPWNYTSDGSVGQNKLGKALEEYTNAIDRMATVNFYSGGDEENAAAVARAVWAAFAADDYREGLPESLLDTGATKEPAISYTPGHSSGSWFKSIMLSGASSAFKDDAARAADRAKTNWDDFVRENDRQVAEQAAAHAAAGTVSEAATVEERVAAGVSEYALDQEWGSNPIRWRIIGGDLHRIVFNKQLTGNARWTSKRYSATDTWVSDEVNNASSSDSIPVNGFPDTDHAYPEYRKMDGWSAASQYKSMMADVPGFGVADKEDGSWVIVADGSAGAGTDPGTGAGTDPGTSRRSGSSPSGWSAGNSAIGDVQRRLNDLGFTDDDGNRLDIDNDWGTKSQQAWNKANKGGRPSSPGLALKALDEGKSEERTAGGSSDTAEAGGAAQTGEEKPLSKYLIYSGEADLPARAALFQGTGLDLPLDPGTAAAVLGKGTNKTAVEEAYDKDNAEGRLDFALSAFSTPLDLGGDGGGLGGGLGGQAGDVPVIPAERVSGAGAGTVATHLPANSTRYEPLFNYEGKWVPVRFRQQLAQGLPYHTDQERRAVRKAMKNQTGPLQTTIQQRNRAARDARRQQWRGKNPS